MTTGEKIALLRKKKGITQEQLAETLNVSRQSVSRWEMNLAFPEIDKLIKLSKLFKCSVDYLLNDRIQENAENYVDVSIKECYKFIRECGYFFLATSVDNQPKLRPFGMIYSNDENLFFVTDKRKDVFSDLTKNSRVELASYNPHSGKWIRIRGNANIEGSVSIKEEIMLLYPMLRTKYSNEDEIYLAIYKILIDDASII